MQHAFSVAIDRQVIAPTMQAMYEAKTVDGASFLPTGQEFKQTSVLELKVYVLSEAYTKHGFQPLEEFNSDLVTVTGSCQLLYFEMAALMINSARER